MAQFNLSPPECLVWAAPTDLYGLLSQSIQLTIFIPDYHQSSFPGRLLQAYMVRTTLLGKFLGQIWMDSFQVIFFSFSESWIIRYSASLEQEQLSFPTSLPVFCFPFSFPLSGEMFSTILVWWLPTNPYVLSNNYNNYNFLILQ